MEPEEGMPVATEVLATGDDAQLAGKGRLRLNGVQLTERGRTALLALEKINGHNHNDNINRALQIYEFIEARRAEGFDLGFSKEFRPFNID